MFISKTKILFIKVMMTKKALFNDYMQKKKPKRENKKKNARFEYFIT